MMDCLEFNLESLTLSDLTRNIGEAIKNGEDESATATVVDLVMSQIEARNLDSQNDMNEIPRVFVSASQVNCNIGFAQLAPKLSKENISQAVSVLKDMLRDIPYLDFDTSFAWTDWSFPDQLVFALTRSLLTVAGKYPEFHSEIIESIMTFVSSIGQILNHGEDVEAISHAAPAFHGFYRSIVSTPFKWTLCEWKKLATAVTSLFGSTATDHFNNLVISSLEADETDSSSNAYLQMFMTRYLSAGRPLTGYFMICCVVEIQWVVLSQTFSKVVPTNEHGIRLDAARGIAEAANTVWADLTQGLLKYDGILDDSSRGCLEKTLRGSMILFTELVLHLDGMGDETCLETYAWETMAETLKLASLCCVSLNSLNAELLSRMKLLLSDKSPVLQGLIQETTLICLAVLVQQFPSIAEELTVQIRGFVTLPLEQFEFEFVSEDWTPPTLAAAAKCLAICIKLTPGDGALLSNTYSLLNFMASTSQDVPLYPTQQPSQHVSSEEHEPAQSLASGLLDSRTEGHQRLIASSTVTVVTCLALEFCVDEVTRLTISILIQRLRVADPNVEAIICYNLVNLAMIAPSTAVGEIIRAFSAIHRATNRVDPSFSHNTVVASQTRLARRLATRPECRHLFLEELFILFCDKGISIQSRWSASDQHQMDNLIDQLAALLLPIDALLSQNDFYPKEGTKTVALFRNMWFLSILFDFHINMDPAYAVNAWRQAALTRIAAKSPPIVVEEAQDYVLNDLEYNSIIRQNFAHMVYAKHKTNLRGLVTVKGSQAKHLSAAHVIFLLTIHTIETMRAAQGLPSSLVWNFANANLNEHPVLSHYLVALAERIMQDSIEEMSRQVVGHALPETLSKELQNLLVSGCHRIEKVRVLASTYLNRLITSFPSLMCDPPLVCAILEVLNLLQQAVAGESRNEYTPVWEFRSERSNITLHISDSFKIREALLGRLTSQAQTWFEMALARAPLEFQATLQSYLSAHQVVSLPNQTALGATIALRFACAVPPAERKIVQYTRSSQRADRTKLFADGFASAAFYTGEAEVVRESQKDRVARSTGEWIDILSNAIQGIRDKTSTLKIKDMKVLLYRSAAAVLESASSDYELLHYLIALPFEIFTPSAIAVGIQTWTWLIGEKPDLEFPIMTEIDSAWISTCKLRRGIFCSSLNYIDPFNLPVEYDPTDHAAAERASTSASRLLTPHSMVLQMVLSRFQAARYDRKGLISLLLRLLLRSSLAFKNLSTHALAREPRFSFLLTGFEALKSCQLDAYCENRLRETLYRAALSWFAGTPKWSQGGNRVQIEADIKILLELVSLLESDTVRASHLISSSSHPQISKYQGRRGKLKLLKQLLRSLTENELARLSVWANPMRDVTTTVDVSLALDRSSTASWNQLVNIAWSLDPEVAVSLLKRFQVPQVKSAIAKLIFQHPTVVLRHDQALLLLLEESRFNKQLSSFQYALIWDAIPPVQAISLLQGQTGNSIVMQYAHRALGQHPVKVTFFFVPQLVQALREDKLGYVEKLIFQTTRISQLFCHQIIWNMKANCYKGDQAEVEDSLKPILDRVTDQIVNSLDGDARAFYQREFKFFDEVTSISGKLKPFIKKTKPEMKAKIDEEIAKLVVDPGVYLPSNPDGVVVDIDKLSGRPLQSHAKAPFMATFKIKKETISFRADPESVLGETTGGEATKFEFETWQAAIFKVGDDCRQDVLALQIIAMFKNVFEMIGLPLYLFPYRVIATGPGCGIIDVVPDATSRDEMGRAKINDLTAFFLSKYGGYDTIPFQHARMNFIQSMAAYSLACYILQIKDRHNGNIMIDAEGHIIHIDFGFLFDIDKSRLLSQIDIEYLFCCSRLSPGGVKFEPNSFKLTHEMVTLMGGRESQGYTLFQRLTVKGFLAIRPYADQLVETVRLMLGTGFPSFKGESTIKRLRDRFVLDLNERMAADYMASVIKNAHENVRSTVYDEFQRLQNGIPYA